MPPSTSTIVTAQFFGTPICQNFAGLHFIIRKKKQKKSLYGTFFDYKAFSEVKYDAAPKRLLSLWK